MQTVLHFVVVVVVVFIYLFQFEYYLINVSACNEWIFVQK